MGAMKKGPTKGSGGKHRNALKGKGPTPKAEDRVYHKAYKAKKAADRRKMADPRLAARRRAAKFTSESDDLVIGRNAVLEALRCGVPATTLYVAARIEHDDRTREIVRLAGIHGLHLLEADRLEMDRIARSSNHQGVVLKAQPFQYSSLAELVDRADKKARAMEAADSESARIAARPLFIALDGVTDPQNLGAVIRSAAAFGANGVILPERRSASVTAAAWKVSAGAAAHMPVARVVNLTKAIESLKERGYYSVGLDGGGDALVGETGFETDPLVDYKGQINNPEFTATADVSYAWDKWRVRYGVEWVQAMDSHDYIGVHPGDADAESNMYDFSVPDYYLHNASVQYTGEGWTVTAGVRNLLNEDPPTISSGVYNRVGNAPLYSGYDYLGRTAFVNLTKSF